MFSGSWLDVDYRIAVRYHVETCLLLLLLLVVVVLVVLVVLLLLLLLLLRLHVHGVDGFHFAQTWYRTARGRARGG